VLNAEVAHVTENLCRALLASVDRAPTSCGPQATAQDAAGLAAPARPPEHVALLPRHIPSEASETGRESRPMSVIRVNFLPEFYYGDDAVLLTLDGGGVEEFKAALSDAERHGSSRIEHDGVTQEFRIEPGAADIELNPTRMVWRLDHVKPVEIIGSGSV
jgi:hypothetical protein